MQLGCQKKKFAPIASMAQVISKKTVINSLILPSC